MAARTEWMVQGAATCDNCSHASVAYRSLRNDESAQHAENRFDAPHVLTWHPLKVHAQDVPDVPEGIASAAIEAHTANAVGAPMAAILMARTVVEATAKSKGITSGSLFSKIDAMAAQGIIRDDTKEAAHEVRILGNDMAHGDIDDAPSDDDVTDVLSLMEAVLVEVFQLPARTARIRTRREAAAVAENESQADGVANDGGDDPPQEGILSRSR